MSKNDQPEETLPTPNHDSLLDRLQSIAQQVATDDPMAEAGRKVLLHDFIQMLTHESGSRTGENIEDVHQMRVATRRMRSALRLLEAYYKPKAIKPFNDSLRQVARRLGTVRDLDVLIEDIQKVQSRVSEEGRSALQVIIDHFDTKRQKARAKLNKHLDSDAYARFVDDFSIFLVTPTLGAVEVDTASITPYQVRHAVPALLQDHLATVRAYDTVMPTPNKNGETDPLPEMVTLHQLRIEFKRLRYAMYFFADVLGAQGDSFIDEIKVMQDLLGRLNDTYVAEDHLNEYVEDGLNAELVQPYFDELAAERAALEAKLPAAWKRFNTRNVLSKFSDALLMLR